MLIFRRSIAIVLAVLGTISLTLGSMTRVAYAAVFDTETYVLTVTEVVKLSSLRNEVSQFVTDSLVEGAQLDSPTVTNLLRRANIDPVKFRDDVREVIANSVNSFMQSKQFISIWSNTNRVAHEQLMALLTSDSAATTDFSIDARELVTAMATSLTDPKGVISKFLPLKNFVPENQAFEFKLIDATSVQDLREGLDAASKIRWALIVGSVLLFAAAWLTFGRSRGATRMLAIAVACAGVLTLIAKSTGSSAVKNAVDVDAKAAAEAIYSVVAGPLTSYGVAMLVMGIAGMAATFYRGSKATDQASGNL